MKKELPYGPETNVKALRTIQEMIRQEPRRFVMSVFLWRNGNGYNMPYETTWTEPPCGTAACLAGHANLLRLKEKGKGFTRDDIVSSTKAAEFLGLKHQDKLYPFRIDYWPEEFYLKWLKAGTHEEKVKTACNLIDWMCGTYGEDVLWHEKVWPGRKKITAGE